MIEINRMTNQVILIVVCFKALTGFSHALPVSTSHYLNFALDFEQTTMLSKPTTTIDYDLADFDEFGNDPGIYDVAGSPDAMNLADDTDQGFVNKLDFDTGQSLFEPGFTVTPSVSKSPLKNGGISDEIPEDAITRNEGGPSDEGGNSYFSYAQLANINTSINNTAQNVYKQNNQNNENEDDIYTGGVNKMNPMKQSPKGSLTKSNTKLASEQRHDNTAVNNNFQKSKTQNTNEAIDGQSGSETRTNIDGDMNNEQSDVISYNSANYRENTNEEIVNGITDLADSSGSVGPMSEGLSSKSNKNGREENVSTNDNDERMKTLSRHASNAGTSDSIRSSERSDSILLSGTGLQTLDRNELASGSSGANSNSQHSSRVENRPQSPLSENGPESALDGTRYHSDMYVNEHSSATYENRVQSISDEDMYLKLSNGNKQQSTSNENGSLSTLDNGSETNSDEDRPQSVSGENGPQSTSDEKELQSTSDENGSQSGLDENESQSTSDENRPKLTSDENGLQSEHGSRSTSDENWTQTTSDENGSQSTSGEDGYQTISDDYGSQSLYKENGSRSASDENGSLSSSDENGLQSTLDDNGSQPSSDENVSPPSSDENGPDSTSDYNGFKPTLDENGSQPASDDNRLQSISDENGPQSTSDEDRSQSTSDENQSTLDENGSQSTSDGNGSLSTSDENQSNSDEKGSQSTSDENGSQSNSDENQSNSIEKGSQSISDENGSQSTSDENYSEQKKMNISLETADYDYDYDYYTDNISTHVSYKRGNNVANNDEDRKSTLPPQESDDLALCFSSDNDYKYCSLLRSLYSICKAQFKEECASSETEPENSIQVSSSNYKSSSLPDTSVSSDSFEDFYASSLGSIASGEYSGTSSKTSSMSVEAIENLSTSFEKSHSIFEIISIIRDACSNVCVFAENTLRAATMENIRDVDSSDSSDGEDDLNTIDTEVIMESDENLDDQSTNFSDVSSTDNIESISASADNGNSASSASSSGDYSVETTSVEQSQDDSLPSITVVDSTHSADSSGDASFDFNVYASENTSDQSK